MDFSLTKFFELKYFKSLLVLFFISQWCISCNTTGSEEKVPITEENFASLTPVIEDVNESGVTLSFEVPYDYSTVKNYGFSMFGGNARRSIKFNKKLENTTFDTTLTSDLICGMQYGIKAFVELYDETYYSEVQEFTSEGSSNTKPWCVDQINPEYSLGFDDTFGVLINDTPHFIYQSRSFYKYNIQGSTLTELPPIPGDGGTTGRHYVTFSIDDFAYFDSNETVAFRYNDNSNEWESFGFMYVGYDTFGAALNGTGYYFSSSFSYAFDPSTGNSTLLSEYNVDQLINSFHTQNAIYAITKNFDILQFDENTGGWEKITEYPGKKSDSIVTFAHGDKAYIGLSYRHYSPGKVAYYDLWELDLKSIEWQELPSFPYKYESDFSYNINGMATRNSLFLFYDAGTKSHIWTINRSDL